MSKKALEPSLFQYVFDASSLINIERKKKIGQLRSRIEEVIIPEKVAEEINTPSTPLSKLIKRYPSIITSFKESEEELYLKIMSLGIIHEGESAAIAIAVNRKLPLVIDDRRGRDIAESYGVKILNWKNYLREV